MKSPVRNPWSQIQILKTFMCSTFLFSSLFLHMWSQNVIFDLCQHVVQRILKKWVQVRQKKKFLTYKRIYSRWTVSESCSQELEKTNCIKLTQEPGNTCTEKHTVGHQQSQTGLPRAPTSTSLKQCGMILTEKAKIQKDLWMFFKKPAELFLEDT